MVEDNTSQLKGMIAILDKVILKYYFKIGSFCPFFNIASHHKKCVKFDNIFWYHFTENLTEKFETFHTISVSKG